MYTGVALLVIGLSIILITTFIMINVEEYFQDAAPNQQSRDLIAKTGNLANHGIEQLSPDPLDVIWQKYSMVYAVGVFATGLGIVSLFSRE